MIGEVEGVHAELNRLGLRNCKGLVQRQIVAYICRSVDVRPDRLSVSARDELSGRSLASRNRRCEAVWIEVLSTGQSGARVAEENGRSPLNAGPKYLVCACVVRGIEVAIRIGLNGRSALYLRNPRKLPTVNDSAHEWIPMDRAGQVHDISDVEDMSVVIAERSVVVPQDKGIVDLTIAVTVIGLTVADSHDLAPGV